MDFEKILRVSHMIVQSRGNLLIGVDGDIQSGT